MTYVTTISDREPGDQDEPDSAKRIALDALEADRLAAEVNPPGWAPA